MNKRRKRCDSCKKLKNDVKKVIDPYQQDIGNREVYRNLCKECYKELCQDI